MNCHVGHHGLPLEAISASGVRGIPYCGFKVLMLLCGKVDRGWVVTGLSTQQLWAMTGKGHLKGFGQYPEDAFVTGPLASVGDIPGFYSISNQIIVSLP